jgi:hypothetical protein
MSLVDLHRLYPECAEEFEEYSKKRRFTKGLTDILAQTFLKSIQFGDGSIWSDSALVTSLISEESQLRLLFESFPGYRTRALSKGDFKKTLSTSNLSINPSLQPDIDNELRRRASYELNQIDEAELLMIEIELALSWFEDEFATVASFSSSAAKPIRDRASSASARGDSNNSSRYFKIANLLEDCILISFLFRQHPLQIFDNSSNLPIQTNMTKKLRSYKSIGNLLEKDRFNRFRRVFYWKLRDVGRISQSIYSDDDLEADSKHFSYDWFIATCDSIDEKIREIENLSYYDDEQAYLRHHGCLAAALLTDINIPKSILESRLERYGLRYKDIIWPESSKIIVSLGEIKIEVSRFDISSKIGFKDYYNRPKEILSEIGIWAPSVIWTDSVLERLEYLINQRNIDEKALQHFFEAYPEVILDELHIAAFPQVILFQDKGPNLKPDFILQRSSSKYIDILELKRPSDQIIVGSQTRPTFSHQVNKAISQLKEYREWFRSRDNRNYFLEKYGLEGFEPRLSLIIGRRNPPYNPETMARVQSVAECEIITYDDLLDVAKRRRKWLFI